MKTSKKVLSLFLSLAMAVTTIAGSFTVSAEGITPATAGTSTYTGRNIKLSKSILPVTDKYDEWDITLTVETEDWDVLTQEEVQATNDIVLVIDNSNSSGDSNRLNTAKTQAIAFVNEMLASNNGVRIAVVTFNTDASINKYPGNNTDWFDYTNDELLTREETFYWSIIFPFYWSNDDAGVIRRISSTNGGSNLQSGIKEASKLLANSTADNKSMIIFSDGEATYSYKVTAAADVGIDCINTQTGKLENLIDDNLSKLINDGYVTKVNGSTYNSTAENRKAKKITRFFSSNDYFIYTTGNYKEKEVTLCLSHTSVLTDTTPTAFDYNTVVGRGSSDNFDVSINLPCEIKSSNTHEVTYPWTNSGSAKLEAGFAKANGYNVYTVGLGIGVGSTFETTLKNISSGEGFYNINASNFNLNMTKIIETPSKAPFGTNPAITYTANTNFDVIDSSATPAMTTLAEGTYTFNYRVKATSTAAVNTLLDTGLNTLTFTDKQGNPASLDFPETQAEVKAYNVKIKHNGPSDTSKDIDLGLVRAGATVCGGDYIATFEGYKHSEADSILILEDTIINIYYTPIEYNLTVYDNYDGVLEQRFKGEVAFGTELDYTATAKEGFTYDGEIIVPATMPIGELSITFNHTRNNYPVVIEFVDENGNYIKSTEVENFPFEKSVGLEDIIAREIGTNIEGYTLTNPDASIIVTTIATSNTLRLVYSINSYNVTVNHVYGDDLYTNSTSRFLKYNDSYAFEIEPKAGFTYSHVVVSGENSDDEPVYARAFTAADTETVDTRELIEGDMSANDLTITFYYDINSYPVNVEFVGVSGNVLKDAVKLGDFDFESVVTLADAESTIDTGILGYTLTNPDKSIMVSAIEEDNVIRLVYSQDPIYYPDYPIDVDIDDPEVPTTDIEDPEVPTTDVEPDDEIIDIEDPEIPDTAANTSVAFAVLTAITSAAAIFMNKSKSKK